MAYIKPQYPLKNGENYIYPPTTADQVILSDGTRLEKNGQIIADKFKEAKAISLAGDVTGTAEFDGSSGIVITTEVSASKFYTIILPASNWSDSAPYTQSVTVNGIVADDNPIVDINMSDTLDSSATLESWNLVDRISTTNGNIIAYCYNEKPTIDLSVNLMVIK